jgi:hypothetical protein
LPVAKLCKAGVLGLLLLAFGGAAVQAQPYGYGPYPGWRHGWRRAYWVGAYPYPYYGYPYGYYGYWGPRPRGYWGGQWWGRVGGYNGGP